MKEKINHQELENNLSNILSPVKPSNEFITNLHGRLKSKSEVMVEYPNYILTILILFLGLFFGVGLFWILGKIFKIISDGNRD